DSPRHLHAVPTRRSSDLKRQLAALAPRAVAAPRAALITVSPGDRGRPAVDVPSAIVARGDVVVWTAAQDDSRSWHVVFQAMRPEDRKSTRLNSSHVKISY